MNHITGTIQPDSIFGKSISLVIADGMESCSVQFRGSLKSLANRLKTGDRIKVEYKRECHISKTGVHHNNLIAMSIWINNIEVKEPEHLT